MSVLFFDIGGTLADVTHEDGHLVFSPLQRVIGVLDALSGVRKGIISNPGDGDPALVRAKTALNAAFGRYYTDESLINWGAKSSTAIFASAAARAGVAPQDCVFIGEDGAERNTARASGMLSAPHPVFAMAALERRPVLWVKVTVPAGRSLSELEAAAGATEFVPVHVPSQQLVLGMATDRGANAVQQQGFTVEFCAEVADTTAYLIRDDRPLVLPASFAGLSPEEQVSREAMQRATEAFAYISGQISGQLTGFASPVAFLGPAPGGVYIAAAAGMPVEEIHIPGAQHGHTERLLPDPSLLHRPGESHAASFLAGPAPPVRADNATRLALEQTITADVMRGYVGRLSGACPLLPGSDHKVVSRHIQSNDNGLVVDYLAQRFQELGFPVRREEFFFHDKRLFNLEAEYRVPGTDAVVLISGHLDSTAASGQFFDANGMPRKYDPKLDPAPGADDDASGIAAVLAAAESLSKLLAAGRAPRRSVRFVVFNAEEQGLVGSKNYARAAAVAGVPIAGVLQMDMIGGLQGGIRKVEIHAGAAIAGPAVDASIRLGDVMANAVETIAPALRIETLTGSADPAAGRSDHASFHERGWGAIAVSENLFSDTAPGTGTRQYHMPGDTVADPDLNIDYAACIARAVTLAAFTLAGL